MDERVREIKRREGLSGRRSGSDRFKRRTEEQEGSKIIHFQIYVTSIIVAIVFVVTLVKTDHTDQLKSQLKSALSYQMSVENLKEIGNEAVSVMKIDTNFFSVFQKEEKEEDKEYVPQMEEETINGTVLIENGTEVDQIKNNQAPLVN